MKKIFIGICLVLFIIGCGGCGGETPTIPANPPAIEQPAIEQPANQTTVTQPTIEPADETFVWDKSKWK